MRRPYFSRRMGVIRYRYFENPLIPDLALCFGATQHPAPTLRRNTCRGEIYRAQNPPSWLHCRLKVSLASSARVLKPRRVTQRLNDTNTTGAINRAPTPEGFVRLPSIRSILSIRSKHLRPQSTGPPNPWSKPRRFPGFRLIRDLP